VALAVSAMGEPFPLGSKVLCAVPTFLPQTRCERWNNLPNAAKIRHCSAPAIIPPVYDLTHVVLWIYCNPNKQLILLLQKKVMIHYAGWIGGPEIIIILVVVVLLFGGKKIPELAKGLGKGIREFKDATENSGIADDLKDIASEVNDVKSTVDKMNPKKILDKNNPMKPKK